MNWKVALVLGLIFCGISFYAGYQTKKIPAIVPSVKYDTVFVAADSTGISDVAAKIETLYVQPREEDIPSTPTFPEIKPEDRTFIAGAGIRAVARADTIIKDHGQIKVDYWFPPKNKFDIYFYSFPHEEISKTITLPDIRYTERKKAWYEQEILWVGIGAMATYGTLKLFKVKL